ncbi:MAG: hypothetical protein CL431_09735 [Acidimicrobiaceae bacterium]|jgi:hypothetical protein|nr:hypothetical protein [Acidimicrobiaceae bacterium]|tara:strand:- start:57260 stop:57847 length:588 start_codon:yes stop_codon:yes gene_type:complete
MGEEILWPPQDESNDPKSEGVTSLSKNVEPPFKQSVPMVSLAEAVRESTKSRGTIRRWITDGKIDGAIKTDSGWRIPIASLVTSGAWDGQSKPEEAATGVENDDEVSELKNELLRARLELNSEKKLREAAERNAEDLRFAMRMLTSGEKSNLSQIPKGKGSPQSNTHISNGIEKFDFSPASIIDAANKLKKRLLG